MRPGSSTTRVSTASSATPVITLPIVDKAIEELEWVVERGARVVLIRPAPVPGFRGPRSFALPEFDPFWEKVVEHDILVGLHSSDSGYDRYTNEWNGGSGEMLPVPDRGLPDAAFVASGGRRRGVADLPRCAHASSPAEGRGHRERQQLGRSAADVAQGPLQEASAGFPERSGAAAEGLHPHQPVLGREPQRRLRPDRRGPGAVRVGLPASRRACRAAQLHGRARRCDPGAGRQDHGRQPRPADERRRDASRPERCSRRHLCWRNAPRWEKRT